MVINTLYVCSFIAAASNGKRENWLHSWNIKDIKLACDATA